MSETWILLIIGMVCAVGGWFIRNMHNNLETRIKQLETDAKEIVRLKAIAEIDADDKARLNRKLDEILERL